MKISLNSLCFALAAAALASGVSAQGSGNGNGLQNGNNGNGKGSNNVIICHIPPGNPGNAHTIEVDQSAVAKHIEKHGDLMGSCAENGVVGDPHFKTWTGDKYDFHGVCDLVLVENENFKNGLGLDIHIRTTKIHQWSYVSSAVLRIGKDTFEVKGGKGANFWINGVAGDVNTDGNVWLPGSIAGYPIKFMRKNSKQVEYVVYLDENQYVVFLTHNDYVRVDIANPIESDFGESVGLLGTFHNGERVGRDKVTIIEDENEFGQEWQVRGDSLFHEVVGAQFPEKCMIPAASERRQRRLGEHTISEEEAEQACSRVKEGDRELCIFDVLELNDMDIAGAY